MLRLLALLLFLPTALLAQSAPRTILVLDGSGSMWGQIDGVNKIVIAREVIADLLETLPAEQELGLMSYGHRRKGDCTDIEMLIEPGTDRAAIAAAVNAINPKGKTPLSAAVIQAAEALRYTEETATVILVSDGIETCNLDPCAVGRELENAGIGFTAHVIGFDVAADPVAQAQLKCLAEETGGQFRTASNADELAEALDVVVTAPEPEPEPFSADVTFRATAGENGPQITEGLHWVIGSDEGGPNVASSDAASFIVTLPAATSRADVTRAADGATASAVFTLTENSPGALTITVVLPPLTPPASLDAPASAPAGSLVAVTWEGPDAEHDFIASADPDMEDGRYHEYAYLENGKDNVVMLRLPPEPGQYEIRYINSANRSRALARRSIEATPFPVSLTPPEGATIGQAAEVVWTGPDYEHDFISVARPDQADNGYETYSYTDDGSPLEIRMPAEPGSYELRYVLGASRHVAARVPFEVGDTAASVSGPAEAPAGATISIDWTGPDAENDYIAVAKIGSRDNQYDGYTYTKDGTPLKLSLPLEPGDYELRYVLNLDRTVLARSPITLTPVTATLDGPGSAPAGSEISVAWTGPDYDRDYVAIAEVGSRDNSYVAYGYTGNGNPVSFQAPTEPGDYELRYIANDNGQKVIARMPITIEPVSASLDAPATAPVGDTIAVAWTGPDSGRDYISIAEPGDAPNRYLSYEYTKGGSPAEVDVPVEAGSYELRYILAGSPPQVVTSRPLEVTVAQASLDAAPTAPAGGTLSVSWEGPGRDKDYIAIAAPGDGPNGYKTYEYARRGSPLEIDVPDAPGSYELRYVISNRAGRTVIASVPLTVE